MVKMILLLFSYVINWNNNFIICKCDIFSSVQFSCSVVSYSLQPHGLQHTRPSCPVPTSAVYNKLMSFESVMPSNHLILCRSLLLPHSILPASGSFQMSQILKSGSQNMGVSASASVLPMNLQDWFPLGWTGWISLQSKRLSRVFSNTSSKASILWPSALFIVQLSHPYMTTGKTIALTRWTFVGKVSLCFLICCLGWL